jgi:hypothetical protein
MEPAIIRLGHCPHCKGEMWVIDYNIPFDACEIYPSEAAAQAAMSSVPDGPTTMSARQAGRAAKRKPQKD